MSNRYTQPKAVTQRHAEILKQLLKRPENKTCADCKRNDPRWASTNLGCFICIRCSGIHRGMGVHITRIKSVDLDTWTPEQIEEIQRWGNARCNAYYEAHLKPGHQPPEHKIEAFIRSKYDTKRWAMEGPVPPPETLDAAGASSSAATTSAPPRAASAQGVSGASSGGGGSKAAAAAPQVSKPVNLFDDFDFASPPAAPSNGSTPAPVAAPRAAAASPVPQQPAAPPAPKRDTKADILSLFSMAPPPAPASSYAQPQQQQQQYQAQPAQASGGGSFGLEGLDLGGGSSNSWGAPPAPIGGGWGAQATPSYQQATPSYQQATPSYQQPAQHARQPSLPKASAGFGGFGGGSDLWATPAAAPATKPAADPFASNVWGSTAPAPAAAATPSRGRGPSFSTTTTTSPSGGGGFGNFSSGGGQGDGWSSDIWK